MAAPNSMHNLTTLIKRLEAATSRLEDMAPLTDRPRDGAPALSQTIQSPPSSSNAPTPSAPASIAPPPPPPSAPAEDLPEFVEEFDNFVQTTVNKYAQLSEELGGLVSKQSQLVVKGFKEQRKFLLIASKSKKPNIAGSELAVFQDLLKPTNEALMAVGELKEANRPDPQYTHLCAVADGIMVLAWVSMDARPYKHVEESLQSAQFFGNRVLKEFKDKDPKQIEWLNSFYQIFRDLTEYVKQYHAHGVAWNPKGESAATVLKSFDSAPAPPPPAAGGPPPPPPPGPPPKLDIKTEDAPPVKTEGSHAALFAQLNAKGDSVTSGLRKVDKSEMTHKNPSLRTQNVGPESPSSRAKSPAPGKKPKPETLRMKKPPRKELEGNKWTIENFEKEPQPIEIETSMNQAILISRCNNTTIIIKGKGNQVTVDNSSRCSIVVDSLVATIDVVKANNFALQVLGAVPTVMLDQVDSAQIYFSKESSGTKVFTSKSAGINLNIIGEDEDYNEIPLPSQICSYYDPVKGDLVNEIVEHAG